MFRPSLISNASHADQDDKLVVRRLKSIGLGVQSLVGFRTGAVLDHFTGEISSRIKQHSLQVSEGRHISATRYIGYLSHGCNPNASLDMESFVLVALRDIQAGELVTIDYAATEDRLFVQFACVCGAPNCRRWITGRKDKINPEGAAFLASLKGGRASA
jgi:hypothetical protein